MRWVWVILVLFCAAPRLAVAGAQLGESAPGKMCSRAMFGPAECVRAAHFNFDVCGQIERQALRHGIDPHFYARLLWQESTFNPNALSHANAMGIAQFIRSTANLRQLKDPYNPAEALEHSAEYLGELTRRYGNMGLAAVAYNGGERRADGLLVGKGLARETINYVKIITGLPAEVWRDTPPKDHDMRLDKDKAFQPACLELAAKRRISKLKSTPPAPVVKKWGAQLAYGQTKARARANFKRVTQGCRAARGQKFDVIYVKNRVRGRPGYYMARISRNGRQAAQQICNRARAQGCPCIVYKNW